MQRMRCCVLINFICLSMHYQFIWFDVNDLLFSSIQLQIYIPPYVENESEVLIIPVFFVSKVAEVCDGMCDCQAFQWQVPVSEGWRTVYLRSLWCFTLPIRSEIWLWLWLAVLQWCSCPWHSNFQQRFIRWSVDIYISYLDPFSFIRGKPEV